MSQEPQSYANHSKMVPGYHFGITLLVLVVLAWAVWRMIADFALDHVVTAIVAVALFMTALYARIFALGVQDRLIRLEERLRMERLLPDDLRPRMGELTTDQLIGLRFAPDDEVVDLARRALDESLGRDAIKKAVKSWRADHERI